MLIEQANADVRLGVVVAHDPFEMVHGEEEGIDGTAPPDGVAVLCKSALIAAVRPNKIGNAVMAGIGSRQNHKTP